ncbi:MAG: oxygenase MpaB family protein [Thermocrispum sp.]
MTGIALLAGGANVIMQLGRLPVGHGVVHSPVASGNLYRHPVKRTRTTLMYLVMAMDGTQQERLAIRREVNRVHAQVRSRPGGPVRYHAMDPELQLWVAACIYRGAEDTYRVLWGEPDPRTRDELYRDARRFGTTLQVRDEQWPADRAAFDAYWEREVKLVEMDGETRCYLRGIARVTFLPRPVRWVLGPFMQFVTLGFLYPEFRAELGLPWSAARQRRFDRLIRLLGRVNRLLPGVIREFPFNLVRWDTRRRLRAGRRVL